MKHYLFLILLIICGTHLSAQELKEKEFKEAHDRIVIAFTKATLPDYVEKQCKSQKDKDAYKQTIKPELDNGSITTMEELKSLLNKNSFSVFCEKLVNQLDMTFQPLAKEVLYDSLYARLEKVEKVVRYALDHPDEITYETIFPEGTTESDKQPPKTPEQQGNKLQDLESQLQSIATTVNQLSNNKGGLPKTGAAIASGALLLFVILAVWIFKLQRQLSDLKEQINKKPRSRGKVEPDEKVEKLTSDVQQILLQIKQLQNDIKSLPRQKEKKPQVQTAEQSPSLTEERNIAPQSAPESKIIYAQPKNGRLEKVSMLENRYYKITCEQSSSNGKFELADNPDTVLRAIKNKEEYIDPVCEAIGGSAQKAKSIRTIAPGQVSMVDGGTWTIEKKAQIEYIS